MTRTNAMLDRSVAACRKYEVSIASKQAEVKEIEAGLKHTAKLADVDTLARSLELVDQAVAPTYKLPKPRATQPERSDLRVAVVYPDVRCGYWQDRKGIWRTSQDEALIDVCLQVSAQVQRELGIDVQVDLGHVCDLAAITGGQLGSKTKVTAMLRDPATQTAFHRAGLWFAQRAALAPYAERYWTMGDDEDQLLYKLEVKLPELLDVPALKSNGDRVLSAANLLGATRNGHWKAISPSTTPGQLNLSRNLRCKSAPGDKEVSGAAWLEEEISTIAARSPYAELVYKTVRREGTGKPSSRTFLAYCPGTGRKTKAPTDRQRHGAGKSTAKKKSERGEQGLGIIIYDRLGRTIPYIEDVPIYGGRADWRDWAFTARCDPDGYPLEGRN
jgi:hypothetical protein